MARRDMNKIKKKKFDIKWKVQNLTKAVAITAEYHEFEGIYFALQIKLEKKQIWQQANNLI